MSERLVRAMSKDSFDHRDELNQEIQEDIAEPQETISLEFERHRRSGKISSAARATF